MQGRILVRPLVSAAVIALMTAAAVPAHAAKLGWNSENVTARFQGPTDGCVITSLSVDGTIRKDRQPDGTVTNVTSYWLYLFSANICTGERFTATKWGYLDPEAITFDGMSGASFVATVPVRDVYSGDVHEVAIDLTWNASGPVTKVMAKLPPPATLVLEELHRDSTASGSVTVDGLDYAVGQYRWSSFFIDRY